MIFQRKKHSLQQPLLWGATMPFAHQAKGLLDKHTKKPLSELVEDEAEGEEAAELSNSR